MHRGKYVISITHEQFVIIISSFNITFICGNFEKKQSWKTFFKLFYLFFFNFNFYFILPYNTVLVFPYIDMNQPRVYMSSQS